MHLKLLCLACLLALGIQLNSQNFINGSFESWGPAPCDINTAPDSWSNYSNGGLGADEARFPTCPSTIPTAAYAGAVYARFYAASPTQGEGFQQTVSGFLIGGMYQIRYYYCGSNLYGGTGNNRVHVFMDNIDVHQSPTFPSNLSTWTLGMYNFTATSTTHQFGFRMYSPSLPTGSGALDDVGISIILNGNDLDLYATKMPEGDVALHWERKNPVEGSSYKMERQIAGGKWQVLDEAHVTQSSPSKYTLIDHPIGGGEALYQLKEIHPDGSIAVSEILRVKLEGNPQLRLSPNPAIHTLHIATDLDITNWEVIDATGAAHHCDALQANEGWQIDVSHLKPGVYLLSGTATDGGRFTERFIVLRK